MKLPVEPRPRYSTEAAIDAIAKELDLPNEPGMQDWEYQVADPEDIEKYIRLYEKTEDSDQKFVLMEMIIQATEDQTDENRFLECWYRIKPLIERDMEVHEYTIYQWCCFDCNAIEECWKLSPLMRELLKSHQEKSGNDKNAVEQVKG